MHKQMSVGKNNVLCMLVPGAGWTLVGLLGLTGLRGVAPTAVSCLLLLMVAMSLMLSVLMPHERDDEMSLVNKGRAGNVMLIVVLAMFCAVLAANFVGVQLPTAATVEVLLGASMLSFGIAFAGYERAAA